MSESIYIKTFGGFSMSYAGRTISDQDNRSKKLWIILEYLIAFHDRSIPRSTMIDLIWSDESSSLDPENALKTSLHRVRSLLDELEIPEKKLIAHKQGTFSWNNSFPCVFDFEEFVQCCNKAAVRGVSDEDRLALYARAYDLYKGDFLPKCSTESWAASLSMRFHTIYVKLMHDYMELLAKYDRYEEITDRCGTAAAIDPLDEAINYYLIYGLFKSGNQRRAVDQYNRMVGIYYNEFGVEPPKNFLDLYKEITTHEESFEADLNSIQADLFERNAERVAYFCDYSVFQHFYKIQARTCARNGMSIFLLLLTLKPHSHVKEDPEVMKAGMERLETIISSSLRNSDVFSRYSKNQYIAMLPAACYENSLMVGERVLRNFGKSRPRIDLDLSFSVRYLEPQMFEHGGEAGSL